MNSSSRKSVLLITIGALLQVLPIIAHCSTVVATPSFKSIALRGGGKVTLRHGTEQKVTLIQGTTEHTTVSVQDERLVIDRCQRCSHDYKLVVEITTPDFEDLLVTDGGTIATQGTFPSRTSLRAAVEDGGTIDVRSVEAQSVAALVESGGRILTRPQKTLLGSISHGGVITYWGSPNVSSQVEDGGMVTRGKPEEVDKAIEELGDGTPALPPVPPVPTLPGIKRRGSI